MRRSTSSSHGSAAARTLRSGGSAGTGKQPDPPVLWTAKNQLRANQKTQGSARGRPVNTTRSFCPEVRSAARLQHSELTQTDAQGQINPHNAQEQPETASALFLTGGTLLRGYQRWQVEEPDRPKVESRGLKKENKHNQDL